MLADRDQNYGLPVPAMQVLRAKTAAVLNGTLMIFGPFLLALALLSMNGRRQTASRLTTFNEAFSFIGVITTAAFVTAGCGSPRFPARSASVSCLSRG
ncbi:MAG: hypothetical protein EXR05_00705 [Acetobacteraceae bacterium]|nr:hypothetical protein [Acetobacteraceae bacterium]MSP30147.1 hypothetical protein [Acetobacteraceae bacterium]